MVKTVNVMCISVFHHTFNNWKEKETLKYRQGMAIVLKPSLAIKVIPLHFSLCLLRQL